MFRQKLGCIADDFTGASDVASFLKEADSNTILCNGIDHTLNSIEDYDAIVVALKTRNLPHEEAIQQTLEVYKWLKKLGVEKLYLKYCSTFDSTKDGNIGPVVDEFMELLDCQFTVLCPSLIENKRTVKNANLYVDGLPLNESSMRNHPLTPMLDSDIRNLMNSQSKYPSFLLSLNIMESGKAAIDDFLKPLKEQYKRFYIIPDFYKHGHSEMIISYFGSLQLLTGASGLMKSLAEYLNENEKNQNIEDNQDILGPTAILAGSCSNATLSQIDEFKKSSNSVFG